jgi:hypothetical protein
VLTSGLGQNIVQRIKNLNQLLHGSTVAPEAGIVNANYSKKLFSLNSNVRDDNHDTYKTATIKINQLFYA